MEVQLLRAGAVVADESTTTNGSGNWNLTLQHPAGDDRDEIDVTYNDGAPGPGVPSQPSQVILTGNGGNPFIEGGWMGWSDMDNGSAVAADSLTLSPCFQTGVEDSSVTSGSPTDFCNTQSDPPTAPTNVAGGRGTVLTWSSNDNRAFQPPDGDVPNGAGGLVKLTVPAGEPDSTSAQGTFLPPFEPTGFPTCTAGLATQSVSCSGLIAGGDYTLNGHEASADGNGTISVPMSLRGVDTVTLMNSARPLSVLHVAHLRVDLTGDNGTVTSGTCAADQYWGGPLTGPVLNDSAGELDLGGPAGTGTICQGGDAGGLPASTLAQTDDLSGGQTQTEVADIADTSPLGGETVYGTFAALAETVGPSTGVALTVSRPGFSKTIPGDAGNPNGLTVSGLTPGAYTARWVITNANGDTRTVTTRFIEQSALQGPQGIPGPPGPPGPRGPAGPKPVVRCKLVKHHKIRCTVTFPKGHRHGIVRVAVYRGGRLVALGHAHVSRGRATLTMRELRVRTRGSWRITVVFSRTVKASTNTVTLRVR